MGDTESQTPATSPGLQALSHYHGSPWLKPLPVPERNGSEYPTQPPHHGVSAEKLWGKVEEVGDTESQAAPPEAMQRAQNPKETYA